MLDRTKDMLISGGENVYSSEVEDALYRHPAVAEAAVIGIPDERLGETVMAIIVPAAGAQPTPDAHATGAHAAYALVQTPLVMDEALKRANARIEELQAAVRDQAHSEAPATSPHRGAATRPTAVWHAPPGSTISAMAASPRSIGMKPTRHCRISPMTGMTTTPAI